MLYAYHSLCDVCVFYDKWISHPLYHTPIAPIYTLKQSAVQLCQLSFIISIELPCAIHNLETGPDASFIAHTYSHDLYVYVVVYYITVVTHEAKDICCVGIMIDWCNVSDKVKPIKIYLNVSLMLF